MRTFPSAVAFTPAVEPALEQRGSRTGDARTEQGNGWRTTVTPELAAFLAGLDMCYLATASASGLPYVQYRDGPDGVLKVLDEHTLGFTDFGGNRQYVTVGNLSESPRALLFLMDHASGRRAKVWGTARVVAGDAELEAKLRDPAHPAEVERAFVFAVEAWDVNCPRHVHPRFSHKHLAPATENLQLRIAELEIEIERLRSRPHSETKP